MLRTAGYERGEMTPSVDSAQKLAAILGTTVGYLLGEAGQAGALKDPDMLRRLNDINSLPPKDKEALLLNIDAFLRDAKTRQAYAS